jgi:RNA polymerase sigma-70 factor (ECF subfamily)
MSSESDSFRRPEGPRDFFSDSRAPGPAELQLPSQGPPTGSPSRVAEWIGQARAGDADALGRLLEACRVRLRAQAARQLGGRIARRVDACDIVQQTYLEACRSIGQFLGHSEAELVAWLQRILDTTVAGAIRRHARSQKRDVSREQPLSGAPGQVPACGLPTPSRGMVRAETAQRLAQLLDTLPAELREALRLRHQEGLSLAAVAERVGRTRAAVAGLLKRGLKALRARLRDAD